MDFSDLIDIDFAALKRDVSGHPLVLPVAKVEVDPDNLRTTIDQPKLEELAASIRTQGLIQPISVRHHPSKPGCFLVNAGERRLRAVQFLRQETIAAYLQDDFNPYIQAVENLQRENVTPLDLARFVAKRLAAGDSRATIAKQLGKPRSFITEVAALAEAPAAILDACNEGRVGDTRAAYLLTRAWKRNNKAVQQLLSEDTAVTRANVEAISPSARVLDPTEATAPTAPENAHGRGSSKTLAARRRIALLVEHGGRQGHLQLHSTDYLTQGIVSFENGKREQVELSEIKVIAWRYSE